MDWTTPLKSQQADFIARLTRDSATVLHCSIRGLHTEMVAIAGKRLKAIRSKCEQLALNSATNSGPPASVFSTELEHLQEQLAIEAIATCLDDFAIVVAKNTDTKQSDTQQNIKFVLSANPAISIKVKVACGSLAEAEWPIAIEEVKENVAIACVLIREEVTANCDNYHILLAGFIPAQLVEISDGIARVKLQNLLYNSGLRSYLESCNAKPTSREWLPTLASGSSYVYPVAIGSDGQTVASSNYDGTIKLWRMGSSEIGESLCGQPWSFYPVAGGSSGQPLASGSTNNKLNEWQASNGKLIRTLPGHTSGVSALTISPNGRILASGGYDGSIHLWNLPEGQIKRSISAHSGTVRPLTTSPDGLLLASGGVDKTLKLWDMESGKLLRSFPVHTDPIVAIAISPDGQQLISGSQDGMLKVWELQTGELKYELAGHCGIVRSVAISADGQVLATGSMEKTIKIWSLQTGSLLRTITGHTDPLMAFAVKQDGQTLELSLFRHPQPGWEDPRQWQ